MTDLLFTGGFIRSRLYLNKGNLTFEDITESAGFNDFPPNAALTEGVNLVDINGDGWLDIFVAKSGIDGDFKRFRFTDYGKNLLFINNGLKGEEKIPSFTESAAAYGLDLIGLTISANFFDYDNDGDLDVYCIHTPAPGPAFNFNYYKSPPSNKWLNDQFLENIDGKTFVDVRLKAGIRYEKNIGLSSTVADVNNDGWLDLYVANDFLGRDYFYLNQGNKKFRESHRDYFSKTSLSSMGTDFADINNDGWEDLFIGEMMPATHQRQKINLVPFSIEIYQQLDQRNISQYTRNTLQINQLGKRFRDQGMMMGVEATEWSWSSIFLDADNDGWKDLFVPNGIKRDMTNMDFVKNNFGNSYEDMANPSARATANIQQAPLSSTPNFIFKNEKGQGFSQQNTRWGIEGAINTRGATYADLDNDGDLDLILNHMDQAPTIYQNLTQDRDPQHYLKVKLQGPGLNTFGLGHKVSIYYKGEEQHQEISSQIGYQATPEAILHFGLGGKSILDSLVVHWLGGKKYIRTNVQADQLLEISFEDPSPPLRKNKNKSTPILVELPANLGPYFIQQERAFSDFKQQRLLYRQYSKEGPGIAVADVNGDGWDDMYIGGASGSSGSLFFQTISGRFRPAPLQPWARNTSYEEMGVLFFDANGDNHQDLYIGSGSNELAPASPALKDRLYLNTGTGTFYLAKDALPDIAQYTSTVNAADIDLDGDLDLFIGNRLTPGDYGVIPSSYLLINENGVFSKASDQIFPQEGAMGRITSALWSDVDNDQDLDLITTGEWLPISIFINDQGSFKRKTIDKTNGWWNSIQGADLDQDGDIDYLLGNHGWNSPFKATASKPVSLYTGDFDRNGSLDPIIFKYSGNINGPFANRDLLCNQIPAFNQRFFTFEQYAKATINNMFDQELVDQAVKDFAYELGSGWIENLGEGNFEFHLFPPAAQVAPVCGIQVADLNQDSYPDIIIGGNSTSFHYEYGSIDALNGLIMLGDGKGGFQVLSTSDSGLDIPYEVKSMVLVSHKSGRGRLISGINSGRTISHLLPDGLQFIKAFAQETSAKMILHNGKQQLVEFYRGSGYLSQSSFGLWANSAVKEIVFTDQEGNERNINPASSSIN